MISHYRLLGLVMVFCLITACAPPAERISGEYTGLYTYNATIVDGVSASVTKVDDNEVNITFSHPGISTLAINNISVTVSGNEFALVKTGLFDVVSGAVNNNELTVSYSFIGGAVTFVGYR